MDIDISSINEEYLEPFFSGRKKPVLVILIRIKGHLNNHPGIGLQQYTAHRSSAEGKGTQKQQYPISKLSHHRGLSTHPNLTSAKRH